MNAASIGIIGGADGPTAIFVTTNFSWGDFALLTGSLVLAVALIILWRKKKKQP